MKLIVNREEKVDKIVGRRTLLPDPLLAESCNRAASIAWQRAFGGVDVPRGVHRYRGDDEAEAGFWKALVRPSRGLGCRTPGTDDLSQICMELHACSARYLEVGGFAMRAAGCYASAMQIELLVAADLENESRVFKALSTLPDNAVRELQPGELKQYNVIRVADEILVDLMRTAGGIDYEEASKDVVVRKVEGVPIPFASPRLLWRMKAVTHREKDAGDLVFLRHWFAERGEEPPKV